MAVVRLAGFLAVAAFTGVFFGKSFWWLAAVMLAFSFFWNASLPMLEAATLSHLGARATAYGYVRLWGSIGFIIAVSVVGPVLDQQGTERLLPILTGLMSGIWAFSLLVPESEVAGRVAHPQPFLKVILRKEVFAFLLACFLMQASHGPYYTFYSIYLDNHGYSKGLIGLLWAFAVICEIGVFLSMRPLLDRFHLRTVLLASFLLAALRWLLIGQFPDELAVLAAAQALHAATFGAFHAAAMQMIHRFFIGHHQHRGQAIYSSASFGLGGAVGSFYSGYIWSVWSATAAFNLAAGLAMLAFMVTWLGLRLKN
jgi:PPP family 3-phenylpropionic acid transporter